MRNDWPQFTTAELIDSGALEIGDGYRAKNSEMSTQGLPFIRAGDVNGRVNTIGTDILSRESVQKAGPKISRPGDVVITTKGTVGRLAIVRPDDPMFVYSPQLCYWRSRDPERLHPLWLFYALQSEEFVHQMRWSAGQTDMAPYMSLTDQRTFFKLTVPPLAEQRAIAATLGALDDKIELNRKLNATLEAMARALFRDWFVDFGPTRAKMEARPPYLTPDLWSLFPDRLDDEGKPEGWEVFRLGDIADQHTRAVSPSENPGELFEHFSLPAFDKGQNPALDRGATIKSNKTLIPSGAILLSKLNPEIARVWLPEAPTGHTQIASTEFLAYTGKNGVGRGLLFCLFSDDDFRTMLHAMVTGTSKSHQRISPPDLLRREAIVGNAEMFRCFEDAVSPLLDRALANRSESRTLAHTRDLLLPRLMSGEIRVRDAERLVEEAG